MFLGFKSYIYEQQITLLWLGNGNNGVKLVSNIFSMNIAVIIPDRGDRPQFLERCLMMMERQTLKPAHIELVNEPPAGEGVDITWRYRVGYERLRNQGFDLIAFIENDDYYSDGYLEYMAGQWIKNGKPDLLGLNHTIYWHITWRRWFVLKHPRRSNAMNTCIVPGLHVQWPLDHDPYTDVWLWNRWEFTKTSPTHSTPLRVTSQGESDLPVRKVVLVPDKEYCLGIKHGVGLCGGKNHVDGIKRYVNDDADGAWLRGVVGEAAGWYLNQL